MRGRLTSPSCNVVWKCYEMLCVQVVITDWALTTYIDLLYRQQAFTPQDYWNTIRPDVELLKNDYPNHPKFQQQKFWGPVTDKAKVNVPNAYKMKWHNIGNGNVQLRLLVAVHNGKALLCDAYVKASDVVDKRLAATMKRRLNLIKLGKCTTRGNL